MDKKESPSSTEKQALEKATGQNPKPESNLGSQQNIQQLDKQIDVAELIQLSMKYAEEIKSLRSDLDKHYKDEEDLKKRLREINLLLKPISRSRKNLHTSQSYPTLQPREKKILRAERRDIRRQLNLLKEVTVEGESKLSSLTGKSIQYSKVRELYDKANGKNYTKRNRNVFTSKLLNALNKFYQTSDPETISEIRSLARSSAPDASKTFKQEFGNILEAIDVETFIMCSGLLSEELYGAVRLTILSRSASFRGVFEELVMPEE